MDSAWIEEQLRCAAIPADKRLGHKLLTYLTLLQYWNKQMDLVADVSDEEVVARHFLDSLMVLTIPGLIPTEGAMIDVGTGAGFPGLPLAMACPGLQVTLMDAQEKRVRFLRAVTEAVGIKNVTILHQRSEDGARTALRQTFQLAVARALAPLPVLAEYLLPYVALGGSALCWKGPALEEEMAAGKKAAFLLGGSLGEPVAYTVPGRDWNHRILPIRKVSVTPKAYPRRAGMPARQPLGA